MNNRLYCSCIICKDIISTNNIGRHNTRCVISPGKYTPIRRNLDRINFDCVFCNNAHNTKSAVISHETTCINNPKRKMPSCGMLGRQHPIKGKTKNTTESLRKQGETLKSKISSGEYIPHRTKHTDSTRDMLSKIACDRLQKNSKYSKNTEYKPGIFLESSYEVRVAEILDELNVQWIKCRQGFIWNDRGKTRRYIPDFYLPFYNLYLDPKNDYLIDKDKIKIKSAKEINNIEVIILSNLQINKETIRNIIRKIGRVVDGSSLEN